MHPPELLKEILRLLAENKLYAKVADVKRLFDELARVVRDTGSESERRRSDAEKGIRDALKRAEDRLDAAIAEAQGKVSRETSASLSSLRADLGVLRSAYLKQPAYLTAEEAIGLLETFRGTITYPEPPAPLTAEEVRDRLELLLEDDRLDVAYVKGIKEMVEELLREVAKSPAPHFFAHTALSSLSDVDFAGILPGQSITWDGVKWLPFTPAGGGGTPVWGEDLTDQGPGDTFTLDHTPITGSVRLFRGGAYQSVSRGDYSINGATITLSPDLADGEALVADYSY